MKKLLTRGIIALILMWCIPIAAEAAELPQNEELPFIIENGAIYYESSYGGGSGRYGTVTSENQYTTVPCYAGINAYSYLDANGNIIVFATDFAQISHEDLKNGDFYVGTETFLYPALNHAVEIESQKVILISDLYTYSTPALTTSDVVESVIIYDPDDARYFDSDVLEDIRHAWKKSTITYVPMN